VSGVIHSVHDDVNEMAPSTDSTFYLSHGSLYKSSISMSLHYVSLRLFRDILLQYLYANGFIRRCNLYVTTL
jgi:hypothetical protein